MARAFLALTVAKSGEIRGAKWSEIDIEERLWTISAHRMKAGKLHRVPLTDFAVDLLNSQGPTGPSAECSGRV